MYNGNVHTWNIIAGEKLDHPQGDLFRAISLNSGTKATNGLEAGGILLEGGAKGEYINLGYIGTMKFIADAFVTPGDRLTVGKGGIFTKAVPGTYIVGRCLESSLGPDYLSTGMFNFATISYMEKG